ncbi:MAG: MtnX-like HAD-IB family phosphatase [Betaproteobacteria bacterium]|nr:MtnX-like HAD-IB family phosphatase [Betaproteobacteria bacterium]
MDVNIICDFDGTIALEDVTDSLLERFADESWKDVEAQWLAGQIGSRDCMARQVSLIQADYESLNHYLDTVEIDPSFSSFVDWCKGFDEINLHVVSDGIDYAIKRILGNNKFSNLRVKANALVTLPGNRYRLEFPHSKPDCNVQAGTCKCAIAPTRGEKARRDSFTLLIGDGLSDVCLASRADFVFAKDRLLEYCTTNAIPYLPFSSFLDVKRQLLPVLAALNTTLVFNNDFTEISSDA